jgi:hypothetical protein
MFKMVNKNGGKKNLEITIGLFFMALGLPMWVSYVVKWNENFYPLFAVVGFVYTVSGLYVFIHGTGLKV